MSTKSDGFMRQFLQMMLVRAMEGESQIKEVYQHGTETKFKVQALQMLSVFCALCGLTLGLWLIGGQLVWLLDLELKAGDYLLVAIGAVALLGGGAMLAQFAFQTKHRVIQSVMGLGVAIVLVVAVLVAVNSRREDWTILRGIGMVTGTSLVVACGAWAYNQLCELIDPFGKQSPVERMMMPYLPQLFGGEEEETEFTRLLPYRRNGQQQATSTGPRQGPRLHPGDADLVDFIAEARVRGLARKAWLKGRKYKLPATSNRVTRNRFDELIEMAVHWGFVEPGGEGVAAQWLVRPEDALRTLLLEMEAVGLPLPYRV